METEEDVTEVADLEARLVKGIWEREGAPSGPFPNLPNVNPPARLQTGDEVPFYLCYSRVVTSTIL